MIIFVLGMRDHGHRGEPPSQVFERSEWSDVQPLLLKEQQYERDRDGDNIIVCLSCVRLEDYFCGMTRIVTTVSCLILV